jgi:hypothetical protein
MSKITGSSRPAGSSILGRSVGRVDDSRGAHQQLWCLAERAPDLVDGVELHVPAHPPRGAGEHRPNVPEILLRSQGKVAGIEPLFRHLLRRALANSTSDTSHGPIIEEKGVLFHIW